MIGLGKWGCDINNLVYSGKVEIDISDDNGAYRFDLKLQDFDVPHYQVKEVKEEGDDTLIIRVMVPMIAKEVELTVTFTDDTFSGMAKIPLLGKVRFKDGYRIA